MIVNWVVDAVRRNPFLLLHHRRASMTSAISSLPGPAILRILYKVESNRPDQALPCGPRVTYQ